jgi:hypothetical protein
MTHASTKACLLQNPILEYGQYHTQITHLDSESFQNHIQKLSLQLIGKEIANPIDYNKHSNAQGPNQQLIRICHKIAKKQFKCTRRLQTIHREGDCKEHSNAGIACFVTGREFIKLLSASLLPFTSHMLHSRSQDVPG